MSQTREEQAIDEKRAAAQAEYDEYFELPEQNIVQSIGQYAEQRPKTFAILFPWGTCPISAGPYREKPKDQMGVKLAAEIEASFVISCPIKDFQVPNPKLIERALLGTIVLMRGGIVPYVGCYGGKGRTGLFLALLLRVAHRATTRWWQRHPSDYVFGIRHLYSYHAVETKEQEKFIRDFDVSRLVQAAKALK